MKRIKLQHPADRYEKIFNVYEIGDDTANKYAVYNILNKISLPANLDNNYIIKYSVNGLMPLTTLSYNIYGSIHLWWLILMLNKKINSVTLIQPGSVIDVVNPEYLPTLLGSLQK